MKNRCASCGNGFQNTASHYNIHGNFCTECSRGIATRAFPWLNGKKKMRKKSFMWMSEEEIARES